MTRRKRLISSSEAVEAEEQHTSPCRDCPWARTALPGWLGTLTVADWLAVAHGEGTAECHTLLGADCAGMAQYRANVGKLPRDPTQLRLPADREGCFASPTEFRTHHEKEVGS